MLVNLAANDIVVLVSPVTETENDVFKAREFVLAVRELEGVVGEVLHELAGIVSGLTLTVGGHDEDGGAVFRKLVEVLEVIVFRVAHKRGETKLGLGFLCDTNGILLRGTGLRAVEDDKALFLRSGARSETCHQNKTTASNYIRLPSSSR